MPGPYTESPNIPGTYRVSQQTVDQILSMGMERALQMARTNPDPEFREAVYRIYPNATGGGQFNRPRFTNPATVGAGPAESSVPGSTGGLSTPPVPTPPATPSPMGGPVGPTGMPNNAPPVPPPPPIPQPTIPTPPVPAELRELFGLPPLPGGPTGATGAPVGGTGPIPPPGNAIGLGGTAQLPIISGGGGGSPGPPGGGGGGVRQPGGGIGSVAGINYPPPSSVEEAVTQPIGGFGTMVPLPGEGGGGSSYPPASPPIGGGIRDDVVSQRLATGTTAETLNPIVMLLRQIFDASPQTMVQNRDFMYTLGEILGLRTPRTGG